MIKKPVLLLTLFISVSIFAQDPVFTQFYAVPTLTNPAFSGSKRNTRLVLGYRNQWMSSQSSNLSTFYISADKFVESINSGVGISILNQNEPLTNYNFTLINASYSFHLKLTDTWTFFPGISFGYGLKQYNFSNLILGDQIDINTGTISAGSNDPFLNNEKVQFFDISAGGVFYRENSWIGISVKHLTKPDISFSVDENFPLEIFLSIHGGYKWSLNPNEFFPEDTFLFLTFNYMKQSVYNRFDFGTELQISKFSIGVLASSAVQRIANEAETFISINPIMGLEFEKFKLGVSYDFPLGNYSFIEGIGEITFQYYIRNNYSRKRRWQVKY
jgi:type IX secretion system PorP/SprF family membrane protein